MKKYFLFTIFILGGLLYSGVTNATSPAEFGLDEGDLISADGDPDIYIVNEHGYRRLFLNPEIFNFYGHLGGFKNVRGISASTRDVFEVTTYIRNCEANDPKVYAIEVTGEDSAILHWFNMSGDAAAAEDADFFKKIFCINNNEFNWYDLGSDYTSTSQVPGYKREETGQTGCINSSSPVFTSHITDTTKLSRVTPPGTWIDNNNDIKTHSFVWNNGDVNVPVYAPVDSTLKTSTYYDQNGELYYILTFDVSCEVFYIFDHLRSVVDKIGAVTADAPQSGTQSSGENLGVSFKAGELLGYTTGTEVAHNWDFGVYNRTEENLLANDSRFNMHERYIYAVCPYDYFTNSMRSVYSSIFGDASGSGSYSTTFCN